MAKTIFDAIDEEDNDYKEFTGKKGFFESSEKEEDSSLPSIHKHAKSLIKNEYGKSILKGSLEGVSRLARTFGPIPQPGKEEKELEEEQSEALDKFIPTEDESFGQKSIRRGLKHAPSALIFPGSSIASTLPRAIAAGFLGQGAEELGGSETAQLLAEITAFLSPSVAKKLLAEGKWKDIIEAGKKLGMSDEQITPLIQSELKQKWLTKLSPKRGKTQRSLQSTKEILSQSYGKLQSSPQASLELSPADAQNFYQQMAKTSKEMPASVRNKVAQDAKDLANGKLDGRSLINFYADINHELGPNSKQLSLFKQPIKEALGKISPELASEFDTINHLYTRYFEIASKLKPTLTTDLVSAVEALGALGSVITGNYPYLVHMAQARGGQQVAREMLLNPRLQQLSKKTVKALNENKYYTVKKLSDLISKEMQSISPEIANELDKLTEDEVKDFLMNRKKQ